MKLAAPFVEPPRAQYTNLFGRGHSLRYLTGLGVSYHHGLGSLTYLAEVTRSATSLFYLYCRVCRDSGCLTITGSRSLAPLPHCSISTVECAGTRGVLPSRARFTNLFGRGHSLRYLTVLSLLVLPSRARFTNLFGRGHSLRYLTGLGVSYHHGLGSLTYLAEVTRSATSLFYLYCRVCRDSECLTITGSATRSATSLFYLYCRVCRDSGCLTIRARFTNLFGRGHSLRYLTGLGVSYHHGLGSLTYLAEVTRSATSLVQGLGVSYHHGFDTLTYLAVATRSATSLVQGLGVSYHHGLGSLTYLAEVTRSATSLFYLYCRVCRDSECLTITGSRSLAPLPHCSISTVECAGTRSVLPSRARFTSLFGRGHSLRYLTGSECLTITGRFTNLFGRVTRSATSLSISTVGVQGLGVSYHHGLGSLTYLAEVTRSATSLFYLYCRVCRDSGCLTITGSSVQGLGVSYHHGLGSLTYLAEVTRSATSLFYLYCRVCRDSGCLTITGSVH
ncbi:hypothetical protein J6590_036108 [Homalodisca vitripennis]|nr:hypothetical protein J6590_036108 [Homalodisca vitripennis]